MKTKNLSAQVKATGDDAGEFEAIVAVFGNVDSGGDVIVKGAFTDTLAEWEASGDPIPVVWSHDSNDPFSHIGSVVEASETDTGLLVKGQLDLDNPKAAQVHKLLKGRRVTQFSFAYSVLDGGPTEVDGRSAFELRRLKLYEVGPTLVGMNQATELLSAKSRSFKSADITDADAEFLAEMIDHHNSALKMSRAYLSRSESLRGVSVTALAEKIIAAQTDEIAQMREWLKDAPEPANDGGSGDGMDMDTDKSAPSQMKAGRVLSAKNKEVVTNAISALDAAKSALGALLDAATNDDGKASTGQQVKDEEPSGVKSEEQPASVPAVDIRSWDTYLKALSLEEML